MLEAAGECAAVDVNLGCPQRVARKGAYGAYLADDPALVETIVSRLCRECTVPVTAKMRVAGKDKVAQSIDFARMLERCGCQMITVHGRTREQVCIKDSPVDWHAIRSIVFATNPSQQRATTSKHTTTKQTQAARPSACLSWPTAASSALTTPSVALSRPRHRRSWPAVCTPHSTHKQASKFHRSMRNTTLWRPTTAGLMANPALFEGRSHDPCDLALEFLGLCRAHPITAVVARGILVKMLLPLFAPHQAASKERHKQHDHSTTTRTGHKSTTTCGKSWSQQSTSKTWCHWSQKSRCVQTLATMGGKGWSRPRPRGPATTAA